MELDDCKFCGAGAVFEDAFIWNNKDVVRCGCQTLGCRGNIKESPHYQSFDDMHNKWNMTPEKYYSSKFNSVRR